MLILRADADTRIGTGHVMRCLALAQAWKGRGGDVLFLSRCESTALAAHIAAAGFRLVRLAQSHPDPADAQATLAALREAEQPWLALDGYHFDPDYHRCIREQGFPLLVIDDTAHLPRYHADILLNQNLGADRLHYETDADTIRLLGTKYILLRPEFLAPAHPARTIPALAGNVLVTMSGSDPDNVSLKIIQALQRVNVPGLTVRVALGPANPHHTSLEQAVLPFANRFELVESARDMAALMAWCDLAIAGAGTTSWELAYLGVPMALVIVADNQRRSAEGMVAERAAICLGNGHELDPNRLTAHLTGLIKNSDMRHTLSTRAQDVVDGQGTKRLLDVMAQRKPRV